MGHKLPLNQAHISVRDNVCSDCGGTLVMFFTSDREQREVRCANEPDGCPCRGFTNREVARRRRAESRREASEVKRNYPDLFGKGK